MKKKNGFNLKMEYWRRRYEVIINNRFLRRDYNTTIPKILALVNVNEITNLTIQKIVWRLSTFHTHKYNKLLSNKNSIEGWLKQFVGYRAHDVQKKSSSAYVRMMTKK